jgi:hypothetical protein
MAYQIRFYYSNKFIFIYLFLLCFFSCNNSINNERKANLINKDYRSIVKEAKVYCTTHHLNIDFFILIDLKKHSGLKRFYIWDFNSDIIKDSYLVSHGCGNSFWSLDQTKEQAQISNENNSHCSSIGKYLIGERGYSNWGIHVKYLLHGQDSTNNNALKRAIVFHSWEKVSDEELYPDGTPEGWGCPAISNNAMLQVDKKLRNSKRKVLMWIL